jgi:hypothetical protein
VIQQKQVKIIIDPNTSDRTLETLSLERQYNQDISNYIITSAEIDVYEGADKLTSGALPTEIQFEDSENNSLVFTFPTADLSTLTDAPKSNLRAVWTLNSGDRILDRWFSIVYWKLTNPIDEFDIISEKPEFDQFRPERPLEVTEAVDDQSFICKELLDKSGFLDGSQIRWDADNNNYSIKNRVDSWDFPTRKITLSESLPEVPRAGDRFSLKRSYNPEISSAWIEILTTINSWVPNITDLDGFNLAVDSYDFRQLHLAMSIQKIASALRVREGDTFDLISQEYAMKSTFTFTELKAKIDKDNDGVFSNNDVRSGVIWSVL